MGEYVSCDRGFFVNVEYKKYSRFLIYFYMFFSVLSVTLNEFVRVPDGLSLTYLIIPFIFIFGFLSINENGFYKNAFFLWAILLLVYMGSFFYHGQSFKLVLYLLLAYAFSHALDDGFYKGFSKVLVALVLTLSLLGIALSSIHYLQGGSVSDVKNNIFFDKQEYTSLYCIYIGYFFWLVYQRKVDVWDCMVFSLLMMSSYLIGVKSVFLVAGVLTVFLFFLKLSFVKFFGISLFIFLFVLVFSLNGWLPKGLQIYFDYYIVGKELIVDDYRSMETWFVRLYIFELNLMDITKDFLGFVFGNGFNVASGDFYQSDYTWYVQDVEPAYESGALYLLSKSGFLGLFLILLLAISSIRLSYVSGFVFLSFLISNIFQDNINSIFWFLLGFSYYESSRMRDV